MPAWSGLWNHVYSEGHSLTGRTGNAAYRKLSRALRGMPALKFKEIVRTFVTDDVGTTALATHTRLTAPAPFNATAHGGVRSIETVTDINRVLVAADETELLREIDADHTPDFPREKSGNSGGGKLGF